MKSYSNFSNGGPVTVAMLRAALSNFRDEEVLATYVPDYDLSGNYCAPSIPPKRENVFYVDENGEGSWKDCVVIGW